MVATTNVPVMILAGFMFYVHEYVELFVCRLFEGVGRGMQIACGYLWILLQLFFTALILFILFAGFFMLPELVQYLLVGLGALACKYPPNSGPFRAAQVGEDK